jgi:hypothetical protein
MKFRERLLPLSSKYLFLLLLSKNIKCGTHKIGTLLDAVCWCETQYVALRKAQWLFEKSVNNVRKNKEEKLYEIGRNCKRF